MNEHTRSFRDLSAEGFDTRTLLRNAAEQAIERRYEDFFIADVDSHHYETEAFKEIAEFIEDPVLRHEAKFQGTSRGGISSETGSYQELAGRITRYPERKNEKVPPAPHRDIVLMERWMDQLGVDVAVMFPTPMLNLSNCPRHEVEVGLSLRLQPLALRHHPRQGAAHQVDAVPAVPRSRGLLQDHRAVRRAQRRRRLHGDGDALHPQLPEPVHEDVFDAAGAELPLGFHAAFTWADQSLQLTNRFIAVHGLGFTWCNMLHMANWLVNGMPERFPKLKTIWIESGLAWIPFMMQRLDNEFMMRTSDAPLLKRKPSEYMREMYLHLAADGDGRQQKGAGGHLRDDQRADAASLFVRLPALGHGPAGDDLRPAVHRHAGQAQYPRRQRAEAVQPRAGAVAGEAGAARRAQGGRMSPAWRRSSYSSNCFFRQASAALRPSLARMASNSLPTSVSAA